MAYSRISKVKKTDPVSDKKDTGSKSKHKSKQKTKFIDILREEINGKSKSV